MLKGIVRLSLAAFALILGVNLYGAAIDQETATAFAASWLASEGNPVTADGVAREVSNTTPIVWEGVTYGYAVDFAPEGYMVVTPDDRIGPVLFYGEEGAFVNSASHPLFCLVVADVRARLEMAESEAAENVTRGGDSELPEIYQSSKDEWSKYLKANETRAWYVATVEDIWVDELATTRWAQGSITDANTGVTTACYNYWTPTPTPEGPAYEEGNPKNSVSGCSATTLAQIVNYFQWPQGRVGNKSNTVSVGNSANMMQKSYTVTLTLMGGDGNGGAYDWSLMTNAPGVKKTSTDYQPYSTENVSMIGRLTRDAGVANGVSYFCNVGCETSGSVSSKSLGYFDMTSTGIGSLDAARANLDAHRPVDMSIWAAINLSEGSSGHSIFMDGYGIHNGRWFYHMNMGWGGSSNGWYNYDEHFASAWGKDVSLGMANIYQGKAKGVKLQEHEDLKGSIISGRVTDANGQPVAGVRAYIRLKESTSAEPYLEMAAWYDRMDGGDCHAMTSIADGAVYRNYTDAKGIWAIDKVPSGEYEIVLEKDGFVFLGDTAVSTKGGSDNKWGLNFVAMPDTISALKLTNWWIAGNKLTIQFNRAIGGVLVDASQVTLTDSSSNVYSLADCPYYAAADSDSVIFDITSLGLTDGTLTVNSGFLYYDVDGQGAHSDTYNIPVIKVAPVVENEAQGSDPGETANVTAITRKPGTKFLASGSVLEFMVTSTGTVDVNDFKVTVSDSYRGEEGAYSAISGTSLPATSIGTLNDNGILTVNVGEGYGFIRVDYIPANGTAFQTGESYQVDNAAPSIVSSEIFIKDGKQYVDINFNKAVGRKDKKTAVSGINLGSDGNVYRYAENSTNGFVLFRKGASDTPDGKYMAETDTTQWGAPAEGQAAAGTFYDITKKTDGTVINGVIQVNIYYEIDLFLFTYTIDETGEVGYLRWVDMDDDGVFTLGTDAFLAMFSNEMMQLNGKTRSDLYTKTDTDITFNPATYGPELKPADEITEVTYTDQEGPTQQGQIWLGPGSYSSGTHKLYPLKDIGDDVLKTIAYYSSTGIEFPTKITVNNGTSLDEGKVTLLKNFFVTWTEEGSGAWRDRSIDNSNDYVSGQDTLILGNAVTSGFTGEPVVSSTNLYYNDLNVNGKCEGTDFIWIDNDDDGCWSDPSTSGDVKKGYASEDQLNWREAMTTDDLYVTLFKNGGTASAVSIAAITDQNGNALPGAVANIRCELAITPEPSETTRYSIPSGSEKIEIRPFEDTLYDACGNVASGTTTTGELPLYAVGGLTVTGYQLTPDNGAIAIAFSKRIVGSSKVSATDLKNLSEDQRICDNPAATLKSTITSKNFKAEAIYTDGTSAELSVTSSNTASYDMGLFHAEGTNYVVLNFMASDIREANLAVLAPKDKTLKSIKVTFQGSIYSYTGDELATDSITATANVPYKAGSASLMPPMFTNKKGSYDFIHAPGCEDGNPTMTIDQLLDAFDAGNASDYCWVTAESSSAEGVAPTLIFQHDFDGSNEEGCTVEDLEDGVTEGIMDLGMYYRDVDGDGRVDAVDMNFFNPWGHGESPAELQVGSDAASNFIVWVYAPTEDELTVSDGMSWDTFPKADEYPLNNALKDAAIYALKTGSKSPKGWIQANVTSVSVIQQNANHEKSSGTAQWASGKDDYVYSTVRVSFDQTKVPARTNGDKLVLVTYITPRTADEMFYDGLLVDGVSSTPLAAGEKEVVDKRGSSEGKSHKVEINAKFSGASNSDEQLGIYWLRKAGQTELELKDTGALNGVWVCNSFGPVMAWDGVAPQAVAAAAWRATPYRKPASASDPADLSAYEFVDIRFSEPILGANDLALYQGNNCVSGYSASQESYSDLANGPVGVTFQNENTIRYRLQKSAYVTDTSFKFKGALYPMSSAMEHALGPGSVMNEYGQFEFTAPAVHPIPASYQVLSNSGEAIEVLKVENVNSGSMTTEVVVPSFGVDSVTGVAKASFSTTLTAEPVTAYTNSHGGGVTTANAYTMRKQGGSFSNSDATIAYDKETGIFTVAASDVSKHPGASFYASIGNLAVYNTNIWNINVPSGKDKAQMNNTRAYGSFGAPSATSFVANDYNTSSLPVNAVLSGPLYIYGKAQALTKSKTSRTNVGEILTVAGIDVAGPSSYRLTGVKVRMVDTSNGAFDPAIALKPLADDSSSGVLLWNCDTGSYVTLSNDKLEWSELQTTVEGDFYREVTLRPLGGVAMPTTADAPNSVNFEIRVVPSENFRYGSSFYAVIPDDGLFIGAYQSTDDYVDTWGTPNGTKGYRLTDTHYLDSNNDYRWNAGEPLINCEDTATSYSWHPYLDGGKFMDAYAASHSEIDLVENGVNVCEIYYAKKNGALNPESTPWTGLFGTYSVASINTSGSDYDLEYNVSYLPGDDMWYDVGGTLGVYDAGIDIPIMGNADKFMLPYAIQEFGARGAQFRAAAPVVTADVSTGEIPAPCEEPMAILAVNMQDGSRGFGPHYVMDGAILTEAISKNLAAGTYDLVYKAADGTIAFADGEAVPVPATVGARAILTNAAKDSFIVVRRLSDLYDADNDGDTTDIVEMPAEDTTTGITVGVENGRDIQQPAAITGVRVLSVGNEVVLGDTTLTRTGTSLAWNGGASVDVSEAGTYVLYGAGKGNSNYIVIRTSVVGGATSETLKVYSSNGRQVNPLENITGVEIMAMGDMFSTGWYTVSYDANAISIGNGGATKLPATDEFAMVYADGTATDYSRPFMVVRRTAQALPTAAITDRIYVSQNQLYYVDVTLTSVNGSVTPTHFKPLTKGAESGVSLWWDADSSGKYSSGDMFVPLMETPVFTGGGDTWTCALIPDPEFMTAWFNSPIAGSFEEGYNFFVCVQTTIDMSFGDEFRMSASFLEPSEPNYDYNAYRLQSDDIVFGTNCTGLNDNITRGQVYSYAEVVSQVNKCTSVTNTIFTKCTESNQTVDASELVPLTAITHWGKSSGSMPWTTKVEIDLVNMMGFDPETALQPMDAEKVADRGIVLYKDANNNGTWDASDTVVNSTLLMAQSLADPTVYHVTILLADESCTVANSDSKPTAQLFVVANMDDDLTFGVQFYGHMDSDYITYNTSAGSASSNIDTDVLTSTLNAMYTEVLGTQPFTTTGGLFVQSAGANVSGYQTVTLRSGLDGKFILSWDGNEVEILNFKDTTTVTFGEGDDAITVTFDPRRFFAEDTLVYGKGGKPVYTDENGDEVLVALDSKLVSLGGSTTAFYTDVNGNGSFDRDVDDFGTGTNAFTVADNISFYDADGNGEWDADEPAFFDTDNVYTLPWMAMVLDTDSINSQGIGDRDINLNEDKLDAIVSPTVGKETVAGRSYLYYVDVDGKENRNYDWFNDVVVIRLGTGSPVTAAELKLAKGDQVVFYPDYVEGEDEYDVSANVGATLRPFNEGDYIWMNYVTETEGVYGMAKALMFSTKDTWEDMSFSWDFLATPAHSIRRITPTNASDDFKTAKSAMSAIVGLDFANNGATDIYLNSIKVRFYNVSGFAQADLCTLAADETSGVQLWRDADGNGVFNPYKDAFVPLAAAPAWSQESEASVLTLSPKSDNFVPNEFVDDIPDFFVVVIPSVTANNTELVDEGDQFYAVVKSTDVSLNKTARQTSNLTSGTITIDSKPPVVDIITASSEDSRLVDTLIMTFDEEMKRLATVDASVWSITDKLTGYEYVVTQFTLDDDAMGCTLKIAPDEKAGLEAEDYSTSAVTVTANFTTECALVDWAGNPAEIKDVNATDKTAPVITTISYADLTIDAIGAASTSGKDGHVDTLLVTFSEAVIDSTFGQTQWTINGVKMVKTDPGTTVLGVLDGLNDRYMVFRIESPDPSMDDTTKVAFDFGESEPEPVAEEGGEGEGEGEEEEAESTTNQTLTDKVGNVLVITDDYDVIGLEELVLLTAKPDGADIYEETDGTWTLPVGAQVRMNFADEAFVDSKPISGISLIGGGKTVVLDDTICTAAVDTTDSNSVLLTITVAQTGFTEFTNWKLQVAEPNTGIVSDKGHYAIAPISVSFTLSAAPKVSVPVADGFYYFASGVACEFTPEVSLNGAEKATEWSVAVYEADETGAIKGDARFSQSGTNKDINLISGIPSDNLTATGWYDSAIRNYLFRVTLLSDERGTDTIDVPFSALNEDDVFTAEVGEGFVMDRTGAPTSYRTAIIDQGTTHLILIDGGYTSGTATVVESVFDGKLVKGATAKFTVDSSSVSLTTSETDTVLSWSDEGLTPQLAADNTISVTVEYKATDVTGTERVVAQGSTYTYTLTTEYTQFSCLTLTDGAYNDLVKPVGWENTTSLYARLEKTDVAAYQWRLIPEGATVQQPWSYSGDLTQGRTRYGWAKLDDNTVLIAGGYAGNLAGLASTEVYDAANGIWSTTGELNTPAYDNAVVTLEEDVALSIGGQNNVTGKSSAIELYKDSAWTVAGELSEGKAMVSAIRNGDKVYAVGGYLGGPSYLTTIEVITVASDWSATAEVAASALTTSRASAALFLQGDRLVVVGGKNSSGAVADADAIVVNSDGTLGAVTALTGVPALNGASYVQDTNGTIWALGGKGSAATYFLKAGETAWTAGPDMLANHENGAAICIDGLIMAVGGSDTATTETLDYAAYAADPATVAWTANTDLASAADGNRKQFALTEVNSSAFAFGGQVASAYTTTTERRLASWSEWITADPTVYETKIALTGLSLTVGDEYVLQVRSKDSTEAVSAILSSSSFTVTEPAGELPVASIDSAKVGANDIADGTGTMMDYIDFTFTGDANTASYRYVLDGKTYTTADTSLSLTGMAVGEHSLSLYGIGANGAVQATPATFTWFVMDCLLSSEAVTAGGSTVLTEDLFINVASDTAKYYRYALDSTTMPTEGTADIDTAIELDDLATGDHTLKVWVAATEDSFLADEYSDFKFTVEAVTVTPTESIDFTTSRTINVTYGSLKKYEYSLDNDEAISVDPAEATIELSDLALGSHSLLVWGIDEAGNKQTTPAEATIVVQSAEGDRLVSVLTADAATAPADANITFTLSFTNNDGETIEAQNAPKTTDFTVANGTVAEIVANEGFGYTVKVTPATVAAGASEVVTLQLKEGVVFDAEGHGNTASEVAKTLVYGVDDDPETEDKLVDFKVALYSDEACTAPITDTNLLTYVYAKVTFTTPADRALTGTDVILTYDTDKFELVSDLGNASAIIQAPYNYTDTTTGTSKCLAIAEEVVGVEGAIRLGGSVADATTAAKGADVPLAILQFNAIGAGEASEEDFVLSAGTAEIGIVDIKPIANDDASVGYGVAELTVNDQVAALTLTVAPASVVEGNTVVLTATLASAITDGITVKVTADKTSITVEDMTIAAGDTTATVDVTIPDDMTAAGDYDVTFTVAEVTPATEGGAAPEKGATATVAVTDSAAAVTISLDKTSVDEGENVTLTAKLSAEVTEDLTIVVTQSNSTDTIELEITAGDTSGSTDVAIEDDMSLTGDYSVTFTVESVTPAAGEIPAPAAGATATLTVVDNAVNKLDFAVCDEEGNPITSVNEGENFYVLAKLNEGYLAGGEVEFEYEFGGDASLGTDYTYANGLIISVNGSDGTDTITTYFDGVITGTAKTLDIQVKNMTIDGNAISSFTLTDVVTDFEIQDADKARADLSGDGKIDIDDVSTFIYYYGTDKPEDDPTKAAAWEACDFNGDGVLDITDVSYLIYYYTTEEPEETRATRAALPEFTFRLDADVSDLAVGDTFECTLYAACTQPWQCAYANVSWKPDYLQVVSPLTEEGALDKTQACNTTVFGNGVTNMSGTLNATEGYISKFGCANIGVDVSGEQWIGKVTFKVLKAGDTTISLGELSGSGSGFMVSNGTATASGTGLDLTINDEPAEEDGFTLNIEGFWQTRASHVCLTIGETSDETKEDVEWEDPGQPQSYSIYIFDEDVQTHVHKLSTDYRAISEKAVVWDVVFTSSSAAKKLTLKWDATGIEDYDLTLVIGEDEIDMKTISTYDLTDSVNFQIKAQPAAFTYSNLLEGWNLLGAVFDLDATAQKVFTDAGAILYVYNYDTQATVQLEQDDTIVAGEAFWAWFNEAPEEGLIVKGSVAENPNGVSVSAGWNMVAPLYNTTDANMTLPESPRVWTWGEFGYEWLTDKSELKKGQGYWFSVKERTTIWKTSGEVAE